MWYKFCIYWRFYIAIATKKKSSIFEGWKTRNRDLETGILKKTYSQKEWIWERSTSQIVASFKMSSCPRSAQTRKTRDRSREKEHGVVSCAGGYGMHTPTYRISNWSRGRWHDRSVGSGGCTHSGIGNRWMKRSREGYEWEDFNPPSGKMTIGDAHASRWLGHHLLRIPPYKVEKMKSRPWGWTACCIHDRNLRHEESNANRYGAGKEFERARLPIGEMTNKNEERRMKEM